VDNEFFVPHGYLSDEEAGGEEEESFNPETAKEKLRLKEKEFQAECKKRTQQIKPRYSLVLMYSPYQGCGSGQVATGSGSCK
jgi:hypothetical protein